MEIIDKIKKSYLQTDLIEKEVFTPFHIETRNNSLCIGTFILSKKLINVFLINCKKGELKHIINYLTNKYNTNKIRFYGVMIKTNFSGLRGFREVYIYDKFFEEYVLCLEGKWEK